MPDVLEIVPRHFSQAPVYFAETYSRSRFADQGLDFDWVQDNQSLSAQAFTLRGLHYQTPPFAQDKLVRVLKGRILDVAVDIRYGSPSFGQWVSLEVSASAFNQILVPKGIAHGFQNIEPDTEFFYKVSAPYSSEHDCGIRWNDPAIGVHWPLAGAEPVLSVKDATAAHLAEVEAAFFHKPLGATL